MKAVFLLYCKNAMKITTVVLLSLLCVYAQTCNDAYVIERNGVEYLRLNGTNNLWACSNTNLCDQTKKIDGT